MKNAKWHCDFKMFSKIVLPKKIMVQNIAKSNAKKGKYEMAFRLRTGRQNCTLLEEEELGSKTSQKVKDGKY